MAWARLAAVAAVVFGVGLLFYPALGWTRRARLAALGVAWAVVLAAPWLVPAAHPFPRLLAGMAAVAGVVKLYDFHVGAGLGVRPRFSEYLRGLPNLGLVVTRRAGAEPAVPRGAAWRSLAVWGAAGAVAVGLFTAVYRVDWPRWPFAAEHAAKAPVFLLAVVTLGNAAGAACRLVGWRLPEPMRNPFASVTPSDFWRRYHRGAQQFFAHDVFRPLGGARRPVRAALATFAVSAALHEYLLAAAVGRVQGLQTAFFLVQGAAVAATFRARPRGRRALAWGVATYAFMLVTSALFLLSLDAVVPFYAPRGGVSANNATRPPNHPRLPAPPPGR